MPLWVTILIVVVIMTVAYRGQKQTVPAPGATLRSGAEIEAVDFYWRPG